MCALGVVLDADATLRFPDFRAEERTFALIAQLAGRAGRGGEGRVLVQTIAPEARAIVHAARHDSDGFLAGELERRRALGLSALLAPDPDRLCCRAGPRGSRRGQRRGRGVEAMRSRRWRAAPGARTAVSPARSRAPGARRQGARAARGGRRCRGGRQPRCGDAQAHRGELQRRRRPAVAHAPHRWRSLIDSGQDERRAR